MKNEKITLVFLAYVIGFTTALIIFAMDDGDQDTNELYVANDSEITVNAEETEPQQLEVLNKEEGLFIAKNGQERILSVTASGDASEDGFHTEIVTYSVSPSGGYVHYCAKLVESEEACTNFVYSVSEDVVYKVKFEGELMESNLVAAGNISWNNQDSLSFPEGVANQESGWQIR